MVGGADTSSGGNHHAFLYSNGTMADLGTLPGYPTVAAYGINASGQVVGTSWTSSGNEHAFLYSNGTMVDLNNMIDPSSGWTLTDAAAINDNGLIVCDGINPGWANGRLAPDAHARTVHLSSCSPSVPLACLPTLGDGERRRTFSRTYLRYRFRNSCDRLAKIRRTSRRLPLILGIVIES